MSKRFTQVCQRGLTELPDLPCKNGINALNGEGPKECQCPWYINSKIASYCWFKYVCLTVKEHGTLYEHTFEEIAQLDNCTATYIKIVENKAFKTLSKKINLSDSSDLKEIISNKNSKL